MIKFFCFIGFHKYEDEVTQITKNIMYDGSPGMRVIKKCMECEYIDYQKLNLCIPDRDLYNHSLWS